MRFFWSYLFFVFGFSAVLAGVSLRERVEFRAGRNVRARLQFIFDYSTLKRNGKTTV